MAATAAHTWSAVILRKRRHYTELSGSFTVVTHISGECHDLQSLFKTRQMADVDVELCIAEVRMQPN